MKFSELLTMARLYTPGAKRTVVSDAQLKIVINAGAVDVATIAKCMHRTKTFNIEADKQEYSIVGDIASDYVSMADSGIWMYNGTQWKEVEEKSRKFLDNKYINWRERDASDVFLYFYVEDDMLGFYPTPESARTDGGEINYFRKGDEMVNDDDVPFHIVGDNEVEITSLLTLSDSVLDYVRWKLSEPLSKATDEIISRQKEYYSALSGRMQAIEEKRSFNTSRRSKRKVR